MARTKWLQDRTRAEREEDIKFFVGKSVNDLRRRLQIAEAEFKEVGRQEARAKSGPGGGGLPRLAELEKIYASIELKHKDLMYALDAREQQKKGGPLGGAGLPIEHYIKRHLDRAEGIKTGSIEDIISRQAEEDLARIAAEKKPPSAAEMTAEERAKFGIPDPTLDIERIKKLGEDFKKEAPAVLAGIGAGHLLPGIEALGPAVSLPVARDLHQRLIRLQSTLIGHDGLFEVVPSPYAVMKDVTFKALVECFDMVEKVAVAERKGVSAQKRRKKG